MGDKKALRKTQKITTRKGVQKMNSQKFRHKEAGEIKTQIPMLEVHKWEKIED